VNNVISLKESSMAHNLATTNGKTAMMYVGEVPWHRLGTKLDQPATAREAITAAGLDYEVQLTPVSTFDGLVVPKTKAVVRYDNQTVLGVVSDKYVPVQNSQAFGFLDSIVAEDGLRYHTAGALGKGEKIWMLAKLPGHIQVKNSADIVDKFLLLSNAHDGSAALRVYFTPIRVVCQNTLALAESRSQGQGVSIMHKGNLEAKIREAQQVLGFANRFYDDALERINRLANHYPTQAQLSAYFKELYPDPEEGKENTRAANVRQELHRLFEEGIGHDEPTIKHSSWLAFNAVTEFVDHVRPTRGTNEVDRDSRRLDSIWFGSGARLKQKAWNLALDMTLAV
jgi:phage/plasmid-like protein (TIGR03299 family)